MQPSYSYRRVTASHVPYAASLTEIQERFVGTIMEKVYQYVITLHKRLGGKEPYSDITGFESWDYGSPRSQTPGVYNGTVWLKSSPNLGELGSTIWITVKFDNNIAVHAETNEKVKLLDHSYPFNTVPEDVGMKIGSMWERELTGAIEYGPGPGERDVFDANRSDRYRR